MFEIIKQLMLEKAITSIEMLTLGKRVLAKEFALGEAINQLLYHCKVQNFRTTSKKVFYYIIEKNTNKILVYNPNGKYIIGLYKSTEQAKKDLDRVDKFHEALVSTMENRSFIDSFMYSMQYCLAYISKHEDEAYLDIRNEMKLKGFLTTLEKYDNETLVIKQKVTK